MAKNTSLSVTFHIGGKHVEKLSDEECERMAQRLSETMSVYYTAKPKEYLKIKED